MSHTDKDMPYDVRARNEGYVRHDHRDGRCVVGTWRDNTTSWKTIRAHRDNGCPRTNYIATCVHDHKRNEFQNAVITARAAAKGYIHTFGEDNGDNRLGITPRSGSSIAITNMLLAGYFPNCDQAKSHSVDIREVDLRLIPGERLMSQNPYARYLTSPPSRIPLLRPTYDASVHCDVCDAHDASLVTCHASPITERYRSGRGCDCCSREDRRAGSRRADRDNFRKAIKEYNSHGDLED